MNANGPRQGALWQGYGFLLNSLAAASGVIVAVMLVMVTVDVFLRNILVTGIFGVVEYTEFGLYLSTVLAAPALLRWGEHIRVDLLGQFGSGFTLKIVDVLSDLLGVVVTAIVSWYAVKSTIDSFTTGAVIRRTVDIAEWLFIAPLDLSLILLFGEFLFRLNISTRQLRLAATSGSGT